MRGHHTPIGYTITQNITDKRKYESYPRHEFIVIFCEKGNNPCPKND
jgi:hypothetical protein